MLRRRLIVPAAVVAVALSLALIAVGFRTGQTIVSIMSDSLIRKLTRTVHAEVDHVVGDADHALSRALSSLTRHNVPLNDAKAVAGELYGLLAGDPGIDWLFCANEAGGTVAVGRQADKTLVFEMTDGFRAAVVREYEALPGGAVGQVLKSEAMFDTRQRPWYTQVKQTGQRYWTEPYLGVVEPILGITLAAPLSDQNGSFAGVCGIDLILARLTEFMRTLQIGEQGRTFIMDARGQLIAASGGVVPVSIAADGRQSRLDASASDDRVVQGVARHLSSRPELIERADTGTQTASLELSGVGTTYAAVDKFKAPGGIDWTIVTALRAQDFLEPVWRATYLSLASATTVVIIALSLGFWALRAALRPLTVLTNTAEAIARGEWCDLPQTRRNDEIGALARAFSNMMTRLKVTLEDLRENEQRLREYAETGSDWFWESDADHRLSYVSPTRAAIEVGSADWIGKWRWDIASDLKEEPEKWREHRAMLDAHKPFRSFTYSMRKKGGSAIYVEVSGNPVFDAQCFRGYRGVARNVTAAVRAELAERALLEAKAELAHVNRAETLGALTASIAHEINQPLFGVISNAGTSLRWLATTPPSLDDARQGLERIIRDGNRASEVIRRVHTLFRKSPMRKDWLDINQAILEVIALTRGEAERNHITLQTQLAAELPCVAADRVQLQQVVLNMIVNAIQATSGMAEDPKELLVVSARQGTENVLVAVRDTGPGFDPDNVDQLFAAFYTTKPDGMGMGLAICRSIIEAHGGRLWAAANLPRGATFQFTLPTS